MTRTQPAVFLDMDGVLVDFVKGLHSAMEISYDVSKYPYPPEKYDIFPDIVARSNKFSLPDLYSKCHTSEFWANLHWDTNGPGILRVVESFTKESYIATYPMQHPDAWVGKLQWIDRNMPAYRGRVILMTAHKKLLANENAVLLDDRDDNCDQFRKHGGKAFLIPQPWNSSHSKFGTDYLPELTDFLHRCF